MIQMLNGNALAIPLADKSVQCVVTSPPYYGLRDYGNVNQIGLEPTPEKYIENMVLVFREVWRVLKDSGVLWLNIGDSYATHQKGSGGATSKQSTNAGSFYQTNKTMPKLGYGSGVKEKDLLGIPWMLAFALRADGWYLRSDIIWSKPNPMPESVLDRPTRAHEYIFLLTKSARYYYDAEAVKEPGVNSGGGPFTKKYSDNQLNHGGESEYRKKPDKQRGHSRRHAGFNDRWDNMTHEEQGALGRNKRSVWSVATKSYAGSHFATFPPALIEPMIKAGSRPDDIVFDPFAGSGTTLEVARILKRRTLGLELSLKYIQECAHDRLHVTALREWEQGVGGETVLDDLPMFMVST